MSTAPATFGSRLKAEREGRGITLRSIAVSTKIKESLLADLERDNLSKWPHGIFGRAFVREYAASIGLPSEPVVAEFVALYGEEQGTVREKRVPVEAASALRLTLADDVRPPLAVARRVASGAVEMCAVVGAAQALAWATGFNFWTMCGTTSLAYYGMTSACWDRTPLSRWLQRDRQGIASREASAPTDAHGVLDRLVRRAGLETYRPGTAADAVDAAGS
jgi:transcriptional regulator with XRE-family HTH domain